MEPSRQKLFARWALVAFAAACALWLLRLDYSAKVSTNVIDLIPAEERAPEIGLLRGFSGNAQARVMLFALRGAESGEPPRQAAEVFARALVRSGEFAEAQVMGDTSANDVLGRAVFEQRMTWLLPSWLGEREREFAATGQPTEKFSAWLAERAAGDLETFLARPEAAALQEILPRDPLLLVPSLAEKARLVAAPSSGAGDHALVWARIKASPFAEEGQEPVFAAIDLAQAEAAALRPGLTLRWTGVNRFAAASRARIEAEVGLLNTLSLVAVLGVSCVFVSRIHRLLHLVPVILLSLAGAWTASTLVFDRLHILVFVVGSLLAGVAIDYGFYIYMQPYLSETETYSGKLRRILKPLLASCLTTVIGFSLLLFSELPMIRQIGFFVSAGLLSALGAAMLYFAQFERPLLHGRKFGGVGPGGPVRWLVNGFLVAMLAVAIFGPLRLHWRDDIRDLDLPAPELKANDAELRALFGEAAGRSLFLTHGATIAEARARLEAFLAHQRKVAPGAPAASLGLLLPTEVDWHAVPARLGRLENFASEFRSALERHGFTADSFSPFFAAWESLRAQPPKADYPALAQSVSGALQGPLALLANTRDAPYWFLTVVEHPAASAPPQELYTFGLNQLQTLNELFTRYRWSALQLSLIGLGLVIASVFVVYPLKSGLRIALIPAGACFFVFGLFGVVGQTLNLFHLLGAFLGVCLSHNYAIFSSENAALGLATPAPVRLSAFSTAASFGVLGFSRIPVIHALGLTVALIVLTALVWVELEPLARRSRA